MFRGLFGVVSLLCLIYSLIIRAVNGFVHCLQLCHVYLYQPCAEYWLELTLGVSEEFVKSIVRESFHHLIRFINGLFAWTVSLLDRATRFCKPRSIAGHAFPHIRWENFRSSTLNWIVEHETGSDNSQPFIQGHTISVCDSVNSILGTSESNWRSEKPSFALSLWMRVAGWIKFTKQSKPVQLLMPRQLFRHHSGFQDLNSGRYRGWLEEVHLAFEMAITELFSMIRSTAKFFLLLPRHPSPPQSSSPPASPPVAIPPRSRQIPSFRGQQTRGRISKVLSLPDFTSHSLSNLAPVTAEHFITRAGYPQESHVVITDDGYVLFLHRLPHPGAKNTVFFQHGVLDTSLGWVCSGVTDSLAFAAWDQGCDVWLGNSRSNPPRRHVTTDITNGEYWRYTLNELGMKDIGAQLEYIHRIKCRELTESGLSIRGSKSVSALDESIDPPLEDDDSSLPYALSVVGHSLGAAALLIYLVTSLYCKKRHYVQRIVLMSPAGFHHVYPIILVPFRFLLPPIVWIMKLLGRNGAALMIPGSFTRLFLFKIFQDAVQYPAIREFMKRGIRWLMNGDVSPWEFVMQLPHYDVHSMPGLSIHSGLHLIQFVRSGRFQLFDYGSSVENIIHYGLPTPLDLASEYWRIDIPVDIVSGRNDGVIPPECVQMHVTHMRDKGVNVSYREFKYGHLEFSATVAHDLQSYVLDRLTKSS